MNINIKIDFNKIEFKKIEWTRKKILLAVGAVLISISALIFVLGLFDKRYYAFDGAEGFGAFSEGGKHGVAYHVTTLEDNSEPGSLRYALEQPGFRMVVFDISGIINLKTPIIINEGNVTIAGQTAPGDGICIKNNGIIINANNVIVRYLRIRPGKNSSTIPALTISNAQNVIVDHCSISWAPAGNVLLNKVKNITIQWSYITETMGEFGMGFAENNRNVSVHHNVFANNHNTSIEFDPEKTNSNIDIRNNIFFNWDESNILNPGRGSYNIVNNYFKFGPNTADNNHNQIVYTLCSPSKITMLYLTGNEIFLNPIISRNNVAGIYPNIDFLYTAKNEYQTKKEYSHGAVSMQPALRAKDIVLEYAGASLRKDYIDNKIIKDFNEKTSKSKDMYVDFGVYPPYNSDYTFTDLDLDGIRDDWELKNDLNPYSRFDALDKNNRKKMYNNRDVYLDSIVKDVRKHQYELLMVTMDSLKIKLFNFISNIK